MMELLTRERVVQFVNAIGKARQQETPANLLAMFADDFEYRGGKNCDQHFKGLMKAKQYFEKRIAPTEKSMHVSAELFLDTEKNAAHVKWIVSSRLGGNVEFGVRTGVLRFEQLSEIELRERLKMGKPPAGFGKPKSAANGHASAAPVDEDNPFGDDGGEDVNMPDGEACLEDDPFGGWRIVGLEENFISSNNENQLRQYLGDTMPKGQLQVETSKGGGKMGQPKQHPGVGNGNAPQKPKWDKQQAKNQAMQNNQAKKQQQQQQNQQQHQQKKKKFQQQVEIDMEEEDNLEIMELLDEIQIENAPRLNPRKQKFKAKMAAKKAAQQANREVFKQNQKPQKMNQQIGQIVQQQQGSGKGAGKGKKKNKQKRDLNQGVPVVRGDPDDLTCWDFKAGNCRRGEKCKWLHYADEE